MSEQVEEFNAYGIPSIAINEDTEFTPKLCQVRICKNPRRCRSQLFFSVDKDLRSGAIKHIVTSPEQLTVVRGIVTRFGRMMHETTFTVRIKRVNVDECHFIKTAGMATGTDPPFRFAFGKLGELRVFLGCGIVFTAFSATMPEDVAQEVMVCLRMKESNTDIIRLSSNRENLSYGVIRMLGSIKNFANVKFLVPSELSETATLVDLRKGVLFIENKVLAARIAEYLNALLPIQLRRFEPIRHLHSSMSPGYITQTYGEFAKPDGNVRLLVATGTAAHVRIIFLVHVCASNINTLQGIGPTRPRIRRLLRSPRNLARPRAKIGPLLSRWKDIGLRSRHRGALGVRRYR